MRERPGYEREVSFHDPLERLARGELPANVAVMQVLIDSSALSQACSTIQAALDRAAPASAAQARLQNALAVLKGHPDAFDLVKAVLGSVDHQDRTSAAQDGLRDLSRAFDAAASVSPAAGSALYTLGSAELMAAATTEVVEHMRALSLLGGHRRLLEVGCGSGRLLQALAADFEFLVGLDISAGMAAAALAHVKGLANVTIVRNGGGGLELISARSVDVVLFADSFPYVAQLGGQAAMRHIGECARILRAGGWLLILNLRYGGDPEADRRALLEWTSQTDLRLDRAGYAEFRFWDASSFLLRRP